MPLLSPTAGPAAPVTPSQPQQALWAIKTYKKAAEPQRNKSHWDYLLEEAEWLSKDFKEERAWKVALAKKAGRAVAKAFADRERAKANGVLSDSARQRKLAAQISKEVLALWTQVTPLTPRRQPARVPSASTPPPPPSPLAPRLTPRLPPPSVSQVGASRRTSSSSASSSEGRGA